MAASKIFRKLKELLDVSGTFKSGDAPVYDGSVFQATNIATQAELDGHAGDTSNPHSVTASQTGAIPDANGTVAISNLSFDPATQTELDNHKSASAPHSGHALLTTKTFSGKQTLSNATPLNLTEQASEPGSPSAGDVYLDDGSNTASGNPGWRKYNGSSWEDLGGATTLGGLSDTSLSSPSQDDVLAYNGSNWVNDPNYARVDQSNTFTTQQLFAAGSVGAPSIGIDGDADTGLYRPAANELALTAGGVEGMRVVESGGSVDTIAEVNQFVVRQPGGTAGADEAQLSSENNNGGLIVNNPASGEPSVLRLERRGNAFLQLKPDTRMWTDSKKSGFFEFKGLNRGGFVGDGGDPLSRFGINGPTVVQDKKFENLDTPDGLMNVYNDTSSQVASTIRGASSQTANLTEWQDSDGTLGFAVGPNHLLNFAQPGGDGSDDPTTDAPADWIEVTVNGTTRFIPVYD